MKQILHVFVITFLLTSAFVAQAQTRYLDEVFTNVKIDTSIIYAENYEYFTGFAPPAKPLIMDVYRPEGDTVTNRPIILLSHNGSFLPEVFTGPLAGLCCNGRKDSSIVEMCKRFARRGYVAVSFDYRLGWSATAPNQVTRTKTIIQAVYRAMQDAKSLVRFFKNEYASNSNYWGIDTGKIVIGGSNSGAYVALAAGSLNDAAELTNPKFMDTNGSFIKQDSLGDFDGFGGFINYDNYPGISSRFQCVLALGGAVGDTSWIQPGEVPVIAFQGVNEEGTPYNTAVVTTATGEPVIEVSGSGDFMPVVAARGNNNVFEPNSFIQGPPNRNIFGTQTSTIEGLYPFYGQYFEPWNWYEPNCFNASQQMQNLADPVNSNNWATPSKADRYLDTVMAYTLPRLYKLFIDPSFTTWNSINELKATAQVAMYPNPASTMLNIVAEKQISSISIYDVTGRLVIDRDRINTDEKGIDISALSSGLYMAHIKLVDGTYAVKRVAVEK